MTNQFTTFSSINGDMVVGFTSSKSVEGLNWFDAPKVSAFLLNGEKGHKKHLGMLSLFATTHKKPFTFMRDLFDKSAVLEVGVGESITYDLPVHREEKSAVVTEDTSSQSDFPGLGGAYFELVLSREFQPNDTLAYDPIDGAQCKVSGEHEVLPEGDSFRHICQLVTTDKEKFFPAEQLKPGVPYMKVTSVIGEYDERYSAINLLNGPAGTLTNEFILGDPRGVETFYTAKAANMKAPGLTPINDKTRSTAMETAKKMGGENQYYFITNLVKNAKGKAGFSKRPEDVRIGPALEYFVLAELAQMENTALIFSKAGAFRDSYGTKMINEGIWPQMRRGKIIKYARPGGITLDHISQAASYIYKNSDIPVLDRIIKFKVGSMARKNLMDLFRREAIIQAETINTIMLGADSQVEGKLFTGKLNDLHMNAVAITSVQIDGIGTIQMEYDESLDYIPFADQVQNGYYGVNGASWTSYSMIIEDATDPFYSNVTSKVKGEVSLVDGGTMKSNIYYIKPEGQPSVTFGYENGRMANDGSSAYVQSVMKTMGRTFWAYSSSAALMLDTTRQIIIELKR